MATKKTKTIDPIADAAKQIQAAAAPIKNYDAGELVDSGKTVYSQSELDNLQRQIDDLKAKMLPLTMGTVIIDPDPASGVYADLFTLPVGKYARQTNVNNVANLPPGMTAAFYCEIVNTISNQRRMIKLYPCTAATAGSFYTCLETSSGYGTWYQYTGTTLSMSTKTIIDDKEMVDNEIC